MFSKLNFHVPEETVRRIVLSASGVIEPMLCSLREKIDKKLEHTTENILVCTVCLCASLKPLFACLNSSLLYVNQKAGLCLCEKCNTGGKITSF